MKTRFTFLAAVAATLVLAPTAAAHVEITPETVPPDSVARFTIEVPTERKVPTVKVEVKLPQGLTDVGVATKPGWGASNRGGVISWSGGRIPPGQSAKFSFTAHVPDTPGKELVFPAIQTYASGPVERWIFGPNSDTPAPRVMVEAATTTTAPTLTVDDGGGDNRGIAIAIGVALVGGLLLLGLVLFRKRRA
jgi:uncharacterized protein YcnI